MKRELKIKLLLALQACDGLPMPQSALVAAAKNLIRPYTVTTADVEDALKGVEADGYASGASDDLNETTWTLTTKGIHKARQL
jgi:hypothetical protein